MKTEEAVVTGLVGLAAGVGGALLLSPSRKTAAAWATSDPAAIGKAKGILQRNGIAYEQADLSDKFNVDRTVALSGPPAPAGGRVLYVLLVAEADQPLASSLIRSAE